MTAPLSFSLSVARQIREYETPVRARRIRTAPFFEPIPRTAAPTGAPSGVSP